jgi:hypothetical protein
MDRDMISTYLLLIKIYKILASYFSPDNKLSPETHILKFDMILTYTESFKI